MDKGISLVLPSEGNELEVNRKNIVNILMNESGKVLLDDQPTRVNDVRGIESSLGNLGSVLFYKGNLDEAEETYKKALKFLEEASDTEGQSIYNENLGNVYLKKDDLGKAEDYFNRAKTLLDSEKSKDRIKQVEDKLVALQKHPKYVEGKEKKLLDEIESLEKGGGNRKFCPDTKNSKSYITREAI